MFDFEKNRVFYNFNQINQIPRESENEQRISDWLLAWALDHGLEAQQDESLNIIIKKPGRAGSEAVILQAHMDMVCEKTPDSRHDFAVDPIRLKVDGDWMMSEDGTSIGADNGIGVASAMAILEDETLDHPTLEVIFTVEEETTFNGASSVDTSELKATRMINLDHCVDNEIIAGSCGGSGVKLVLPLQWEDDIPSDMAAYRITLTGLKGGHSGEDIHRGHGNAIEMIIRVLEKLSLKTISVTGGNNRLAIPREASAVVLTDDFEKLQQAATEMKNMFCKEYGSAAPDLDILIEEAAAEQPLTDESLKKLMCAVKLIPNGIISMNGAVAGVVESSNNLGILKTDSAQGNAEFVCEIRGAYTSTVEDIKKKILCLAELVGASVEFFSQYVPWEYTGTSALRSRAQDVYYQLYGEDMNVNVIHAGLECGIFAEKLPVIDIISVGPICYYFHSPNEKISISSTNKFYNFLRELLAAL